MSQRISAFALPSSVLVALALIPVQAFAQLQAPRFTSASNPVLMTVTPDTPVTMDQPGWIPPLASAIIPGSGQLMMGQERGALYLAVEVLLITRFFALQGDGRRAADRYRDLALEVARRPFDPVIRDTVFEYFEKMQKFIESGPFDTDPGAALVPPTDERIYNGSIWKLARETFFTNPDSLPDPGSLEYQQALAFYRRRAIGENFRWSWRNAGLEQDLYRQSIRLSDESFRQASQYLGLLLANHLLSAIDAFVTVRLSRTGRTINLNSAVWKRENGRMQGVVSVAVGF